MLFTRISSAVLFLLLSLSSLNSQDIKTLSVLYFTNTVKNPDYDWLSKGLSDMLVSDLGASGKITVVEREDLEKLLQEQEFMDSGMADPSKSFQVGKILGADVLVYGSYLLLGKSLRIDAKAVDPRTGAVTSLASVSGLPESLLDMVRVLVTKLAQGLKLEIGPQVGGPGSLESAKAYYLGLNLLDTGQYQAALTSFNEAVRLDPLYTKPGLGIEAAYKYLRDFKSQRYRREMNALASDIQGLTRRILAPNFYSFGDTVQNPAQFGYRDATAASQAYQANPRVMAGDTPVQAIWNLQLLYQELGGLAREYFNDESLTFRCQDQILYWTKVAEKSYPGDFFLPEVLYQPLFVYQDRQQWENVKNLCEQLMENYPDYRMMWAVEDAYERALERLEQGRS